MEGFAEIKLVLIISPANNFHYEKIMKIGFENQHFVSKCFLYWKLSRKLIMLNKKKAINEHDID